MRALLIIDYFCWCTFEQRVLRTSLVSVNDKVVPPAFSSVVQLGT